jgi:hypothetical protein
MAAAFAAASLLGRSLPGAPGGCSAAAAAAAGSASSPAAGSARSTGSASGCSASSSGTGSALGGDAAAAGSTSGRRRHGGRPCCSGARTRASSSPGVLASVNGSSRRSGWSAGASSQPRVRRDHPARASSCSTPSASTSTCSGTERCRSVSRCAFASGWSVGDSTTGVFTTFGVRKDSNGETGSSSAAVGWPGPAACLAPSGSASSVPPSGGTAAARRRPSQPRLPVAGSVPGSAAGLDSRSPDSVARWASSAWRSAIRAARSAIKASRSWAQCSCSTRAGCGWPGLWPGCAFTGRCSHGRTGCSGAPIAESGGDGGSVGLGPPPAATPLLPEGPPASSAGESPLGDRESHGRAGPIVVELPSTPSSGSSGSMLIGSPVSHGRTGSRERGSAAAAPGSPS